MHSAKVFLIIPPCSLDNNTHQTDQRMRNFLILDKSYAYLVYTNMVTLTKLKYFMSQGLEALRSQLMVNWP